jgi:recombinational DNA repair ATPase RecF
MQLTAFRILKYRNIEDSGLIKLADHLTCIVGKNQSGKTNLLKEVFISSIRTINRSNMMRGGIGPEADGGLGMKPRLYAKPISTWTRSRTNLPA